jgi:multiple sugar transport system permease protein
MPYLWLLVSSFRPLPDIFAHTNPVSWKTFVPIPFTWRNYQEVFSIQPFARFLLNSGFVASVVTLSGLLVNSMAAYAFSRLEFPGRDILFLGILATMIIPIEVVSLPLYLIMRLIGWVDTYEALIIPWIANGFNIFLLRQFFLEIPGDLEDAAKIDGCSYWRCYWNVILPCAKPALITVGLMTFQQNWDSFLWPLIATNSLEKRVIQIAVASSMMEVASQWNHIFVACTVASVPILLVFLILQRHYVRGITTSGLKG